MLESGEFEGTLNSATVTTGQVTRFSYSIVGYAEVIKGSEVVDAEELLVLAGRLLLWLLWLLLWLLLLWFSGFLWLAE